MSEQPNSGTQAGAADCIIREATAADHASVLDIYNHFIESSPCTFDTTPFTIEARAPWFVRFSDGARHRLLVAACESEIVGYACSTPFRPKPAYDTTVETTVYLRPGFQGRGLGVDLYEALFAALATEDLHRAYAIITLPNDASIALHRKFRFHDLATLTEVGRKFDRYWDTLWMERVLP
jgi:phosphinothricin acetyltransferase